MKKYIITGIALVFCANLSFAQTDSIFNSYQKQFDQFKQSIEQEHQQFKNSNDSVFVHFLKDSWKEFEAFKNETPKEPKPLVQPVVTDTPVIKNPEPEIIPVDTTRKQTPVKIDTLPAPEKKILNNEPAHTGKAMFGVDFLGTENLLPIPGNLPLIQEITENSIADYFNKTSRSEDLAALIVQLKNVKSNLQLNDWGYYQFLCKTAETLDFSVNRQVLFTWVALLKSGFNAKIGYAENDLYLLLPFKEVVYGTYYTIDNVRYYIQPKHDNQEFSRLKIHAANYPESEQISLSLFNLPRINSQSNVVELDFKGKKIKVTNNLSLKEFYASYPFCGLNIYFSAPLSQQVKKSLSTFFQPDFQEKTDKQKVSVLLEFVQKAFQYKTDMDQFKYEKYFFPDELFLYPYSDCEDRSVLFARLVKQFTKLECIGLDYPGHINTAIFFGDETEGTTITHKNRKFSVCDPTFSNAPIGYLAPEYKNFQPEIISFE